MTDQKVKEIFKSLQDWHSNIVDQLDTAIESPGNIQLQDSKGNKTNLSKEKAEAVRIGISIALDLIKDFPLTLKENNNVKL